MKRKRTVFQRPNRRIYRNKRKESITPGSWKERKKEIKHRWATSFIWVEWLLFSKPLFKFFQLIAYGWLIAGIIIYWREGDKRIKQKHYQAWQVINLAQGKTGSGGRIQALQELNEDGVSLTGVDIVKAYLVHINLQGADLQEADLQEANLWRAYLQGADLRWADLQKAYLGGANLLGANLRGANLREADLLGANLREADLREAEYITIEQLSTVKTLYKAKLDPEIEKQIKEKYPHLLEEPK